MRNIKKIFSILIFFLLIISCKQASQDNSLAGSVLDTDFARQVDNVLSQFFSKNRPGASVIVKKKGEVLFRRGYGLADLEHTIPIEPDMVFRIASLTKQFTAVLIMQLVEQGKISLDDEIIKFFPPYLTQGNKVTVTHLLTHTSGIKNFHELDDFQEHLHKDFTLLEMIDRFKNEPLDFTPGERYRYSSSGYLVLGAILEKVTGKTYEENLKEKIFIPLGMKNSYIGRNDTIIPRRVRGYTLEDGRIYNIMQGNLTQTLSSGSLAMSVDDMAIWDDALYTDTLLSDQSKERMWTPFVLNDGRSGNYGFGWELTEFLEHKLISHTGSIDGFTSAAIRVPDEHIFIAVFFNFWPPDPSPAFLAKRILSIALGVPEKQPLDMSVEHYQKYVGTYKTENKRITFVVEIEDRSLFLTINRSRFEILPESETRFFFKAAFHLVDFEMDENGDISKLVFKPEGGLIFQAEKEQ